jgi:hypothetical protein
MLAPSNVSDKHHTDVFVRECVNPKWEGEKRKMANTGVLPFVRGVDFTNNDFSVSISGEIFGQACA